MLIGVITIYRQRGAAVHREADRTCRKLSPPKPSSPSRTRGCSTSCAKSLQQQTATADVLKVISPVRRATLKPVFQAMLENADAHLSTPNFGTLRVHEDGAFRSVAHRTTRRRHLPSTRRRALRPHPDSGSGPLWRERKRWRTSDDTRSQSLYLRATQPSMALADLAGRRTLLSRSDAQGRAS